MSDSAPEPRHTKCTSCGWPVIFGVTLKGSWMPLSKKTQRVLNIGEAPKKGEFTIGPDNLVRPAKLADYGRTVYTSHFADCPHAKRHRKGRGR